MAPFQDFGTKVVALCQQSRSSLRFPQMQAYFGGQEGGKHAGTSRFYQLLLDKEPEFREAFGSNVLLAIPKTSIIRTECSERFINGNKLWKVLDQDLPDQQIIARFLAAGFDNESREIFTFMLTDGEYGHKRPIYVRSSGLGEDSDTAPHPGVFWSVPLPNISDSLEIRLEQFERGLKLVYASLFLSHARAYRKLVGLTGPGKMAIMVQNMVGQVWNSPSGQQHYCPEISCACFSYDNHGKGMMKKENGIARIALGMGHGVVGGNMGMAAEANLGKPYPLRGFDSVEHILKVSPRHFFALDLSNPDALLDSENFFLKKHSIVEAADPKMVRLHQSGYDNFSLRPGGEGSPVYNFPYLFDERHSSFVNVMKFENSVLVKDYGMDADHEDAYLQAKVDGEKYEIFFPLQARPQVHSGKSRLDALPEVQDGCRVLSIENAIGNGKYSIQAAIFVPSSAFSSKTAMEISEEIARMNRALEAEGKKYVLFVPGRFGNTEPEHYCGIPGSIATVSGTSGVFEHIPKDSFTPGSQGDHFAVEFSSLGIAAGDYHDEGDLVQRLGRHASSSENGKYATIFRFGKPLEMLIDKADSLLIHAP